MTSSLEHIIDDLVSKRLFMSAALLAEGHHDWSRACDLWLQFGSNSSAAQCAEKAGNFSQAMTLYRMSGNSYDEKRCAALYSQIVKGFEEGIAAFDQKRYQRAAPYFQNIITADPNHIEALYYLGRTKHAQGKNTEALLLLEKVLALIDEKQRKNLSYSARVKKSQVYFALAQTAYAEKLYEKGTTALSRALKCAPHDTVLQAYASEKMHELEREGIKYFNKDRYPEAFPLLASAQTLGASGDWLTWRIGRCYEAAGDMTRARKMYTSLPDFKNAQIGLRRIKNATP